MTVPRPTDHDPAIRAELRRVLAAEFAHDPSTLLVDEFGILEGRSRVDIAAVNGALHGYEIKSGRDTLTRFDGQAGAYARVFDYVTVVAVGRHLTDLTALLPACWGLFEATADADRVQIHCIRRPQLNRSVDPNSIVQLLWREEAARILVELGVKHGVAGKPRRVVWQRLVETIGSTEMLRLYVRETIKARSEWRRPPSATPEQ